ncbi:hypothetical protein EPUL_005817 [Erysiphe pulchra]|uniref:Uncharacterized protein n=1 Tax=Erysiphe pulchra TaxID=225359 RepID=A0A2S4PUG4_9PEZI|nr:hypothetical protein EPUL_005817 [Erysiphe pulchra]
MFKYGTKPNELFTTSYTLDTMTKVEDISIYSSPTSSPTLPIPLLTHLPDPFISSQLQPLSTSIPLSIAVAKRQIREPVSPSRCVLPDISQNKVEEMDNTVKSTQAKKANHVKNMNEPKAPNKLPRRQAPEGKPTLSGNADKGSSTKLSPAGIREIVVKKLAISPAKMNRIKSVHEGFALSLCNNDTWDKILERQHGLFMSDAKLEPATSCVSGIV